MWVPQSHLFQMTITITKPLPRTLLAWCIFFGTGCAFSFGIGLFLLGHIGIFFFNNFLFLLNFLCQLQFWRAIIKNNLNYKLPRLSQELPSATLIRQCCIAVLDLEVCPTSWHIHYSWTNPILTGIQVKSMHMWAPVANILLYDCH